MLKMMQASMAARPPSRPTTVRAAAVSRKPPKSKTPKTEPKKNPPPAVTTQGFGAKKKDPTWQCVQNCGACCKLDKGPSFPSPEEIFEDPSDVEEYKSMVGADGWCIHYDKPSRKCSIYAERPYFCRVDPEVFILLYGIEKKHFNKEACGSCIGTIKAVYGTDSKELETFNHAIWSSGTE